jgi:predicted DNA-binding protein (MmcQ/YjbR family)
VRLKAIEERIRSTALAFPGAYEDRPWGDFPVFKVGQNKVFGWAVVEDGAVHVTMKLTAEEREIGED